ncbi:MAG: sulfite exporter TauE/SafE family protein [Candidatus Synoicihabitans palmerolidicus]|nr:sulfite exporter TauE/SafE family protein [Candidatus Synoicihabitans palmerolidicus]
MDLAAINTPTEALLAGLVTSLHCAGMCGPLACMLGPAKGERADATTVNTVYHVSRLTGYVLLGVVAGAIGMVPRGFFSDALVRWFPWLLVVFFLMVALRGDHRLPRLVWLSRWALKIQAKLRAKPRVQVTAVMGALTPLLPCGPLYFLVTLSAMTGSALRGGGVHVGVWDWHGAAPVAGADPVWVVEAASLAGGTGAGSDRTGLGGGGYHQLAPAGDTGFLTDPLWINSYVTDIHSIHSRRRSMTVNCSCVDIAARLRRRVSFAVRGAPMCTG